MDHDRLVQVVAPTALTATLVGLQMHPVRVSVTVVSGEPSFKIVGLSDDEARETRERVTVALMLMGVDVHTLRVVVRLSPTNLPKGGGGVDLAIAAATLEAGGIVPPNALNGVLLVGELASTGRVQPVRGLLPLLLGAQARGIRSAVVPRANAHEASNVEGVDVHTVARLAELKDAFRDLPRADMAAERHRATEDSPEADLSDVRGLAGARRALEVAAAGAHPLLLVGPPGSGKVMLARRLPGILPPLTQSEASEVAAIHSVAGLLASVPSTRHPFRAPHHTVSELGLTGGGGELPRPGEASLSHHGVLFLDEVTEFRGPVLKALGRALAQGSVAFWRRGACATFPVRPLLVCARTPCPCGYLGDGTGRCTCAPERVQVHGARIPSPLLDHIEIQIVLPALRVAELSSRSPGETSAVVRSRVERARALQTVRFDAGEVTSPTNTGLSPQDLGRVVQLDGAGALVMVTASSRLPLSPRTHAKILRVARTIADLAGIESVGPEHLAEAVGLTALDHAPQVEHG